MMRRSVPNMIAEDIANVQPMTLTWDDDVYIWGQKPMKPKTLKDLVEKWNSIKQQSS